jgi:hypothetical protein
VKHCFNLKIGNCIFSISAPENLLLEIHPNILPFKTANVSESHVKIQLQVGYPEFNEEIKQLTNARNLPEFYNHEQKYHYYTLNKTHNQFIIITGEEGRGAENKRMAVSDFGFRNWTIYISESESGNQISPLSFPLGPLIFYYGITLCDGLLIHASGISYLSSGYIFAGFSGIGKTTISNLWLERGGQLINDDRLALMAGKNGFYMYNTPMAYHQESKSSRVSAVFLLKQATENKAIRLTKGAALARVLALCIQHDHDKNLVDSLVKNVHQLIEAVPVYELGFKPDHSIIQYIEQHQFYEG